MRPVVPPTVFPLHLKFSMAYPEWTTESPIPTGLPGKANGVCSETKKD